MLAPEAASWECKKRTTNPHPASRNRLPILNPDQRPWLTVYHLDVRELEGRLPLEHADKVVEIPGARRLLDELTSIAAPWTIVTSSTSTLVSGWLNLLHIAMHIQPVTSESVEKGKPDPACYILGREKLGLVSPGKEILVVEDSPTGIVAAKAAGCRVIGLTTSHRVDQITAAKPDWIVQDFESLKVVQHAGGRVTVEISNALQSTKQ